MKFNIKFIIRLKRSFYYHFINGNKIIDTSTNKIKHHYSITNPRAKNDQIQLIVMIDGKVLHGGLVDRLRGIISLYEFTKNRKFEFKIYYIYPFDINRYLERNKVNWFISSDDICYNSEDSLPLHIESYGYFFESLFHKKILKNIKEGFKQYHIYTNINTFKNFSKSFNELFKPTLPLLNSVNHNLEKINLPYVAIVLRFQQLLGDFKEGDYPTLSERYKVQLINKCIKKIIELKKNVIKTEKILITSDSLTFLNEIKKIDFVYTIPGKTVHMDYVENESFEIYLKSFTDFLVVSNSQSVYLLTGNGLYRSGFAKGAALLNNVPYYEINL